MITAHLPSGYLTGRVFPVAGPVLWAAMIGGVLPDVDLIWFYFIDDRAFHHHNYWVHVPGFWLAMATIVFPIVLVLKPAWMQATFAFLPRSSCMSASTG